jgi:dTMP kinase
VKPIQTQQIQDMSGKIIAIDGGENIGKATQADMLVHRLMEEGISVGKLDFPRYHQNTFGRLIEDAITADSNALSQMEPKVAATLFAADRYESKQQISEWLNEGRTILFDRYVPSNMLHQGARFTDADARGEFFAWVEHVEHEVFGLPRPDLTVYLDVPPSDTHKLLEYVEVIGGQVTDPQDHKGVHQAKVADCARHLSTTYLPWVNVTCVTEDGTLRTREDLHNEVYRTVKEKLWQ